MTLVAGPERPRAWQDRVFPQVRSMIERHVDALENELAAQPGTARQELVERIEFWKEELEALSRDPEQIPLKRGLP